MVDFFSLHLFLELIKPYASERKPGPPRRLWPECRDFGNAKVHSFEHRTKTANAHLARSLHGSIAASESFTIHFPIWQLERVGCFLIVFFLDVKPVKIEYAQPKNYPKDYEAANTEAGLSKTTKPPVPEKTSRQKDTHGIIWKMEGQWF